MHHVARLAFSKVLAKHLIGFAANTAFYQKSGEMGARDQLGIAHKLQRAFISVFNTDFGQAIRHFHGTLGTPAARGLQAVNQISIAGIKAKANNVYGFARKCD